MNFTSKEWKHFCRNMKEAGWTRHGTSAATFFFTHPNGGRFQPLNYTRPYGYWWEYYANNDTLPPDNFDITTLATKEDNE